MCIRVCMYAYRHIFMLTLFPYLGFRVNLVGMQVLYIYMYLHTYICMYVCI